MSELKHATDVNAGRLHVVRSPHGDASDEQLFAEAMTIVAVAYEEALTTLPPDHPDRAWFQGMCRDARVCAGLAPVATRPVAAVHRRV